jgi:hypothetical protein
MTPIGTVSAPLLIVKAEFILWCRNCTCSRGCHLCAVFFGVGKAAAAGFEARAAFRLPMLGALTEHSVSKPKHCLGWCSPANFRCLEAPWKVLASTKAVQA